MKGSRNRPEEVMQEEIRQEAGQCNDITQYWYLCVMTHQRKQRSNVRQPVIFVFILFHNDNHNG